MFVIAVYDIGERRVVKVLKIFRKYLNWVQNSVFEGEIGKAGFLKLKIEISNVINKKEDSVIFYILRDTKYSSREIIGVEKNKTENIL